MRSIASFGLAILLFGSAVTADAEVTYHDMSAVRIIMMGCDNCAPTGPATMAQYKLLVEACGPILKYSQRDKVTKLRYHIVYHSMSQCRKGGMEDEESVYCVSHFINVKTKSCSQEFLLSPFAEQTEFSKTDRYPRRHGKKSAPPVIMQDLNFQYWIYEWVDDIGISYPPWTYR